MTKYKFDILLGHYVAINEGEVLVDGTLNTEATTLDNTTAAVLTNLDTEDVLKVKKDLEKQIENFDKEIQNKKDIILLIKNKIAQLQSSNNASQQSLNTLQKDLLLANLDVETKIFDKAKKVYDMHKQILDLQKSLITENLNALKLPNQYKDLNEDIINENKIYLNNFVGEDKIIKSMNEFKNAFCLSKLLYGSDKNGYFAVCFNNNDINKLQNVLLETGYNNDLIIASITPQLIS